MIQAFAIAYFNIKYGWIRVDPRSPSLSQLAITPLHLSVWLCAGFGFVMGGVSAYAWFKGQWRFASIGTGLFFALMFASKWLESL